VFSLFGDWVLALDEPLDIPMRKIKEPKGLLGPVLADRAVILGESDAVREVKSARISEEYLTPYAFETLVEDLARGQYSLREDHYYYRLDNFFVG
jgi:hypothetical protein